MTATVQSPPGPDHPWRRPNPIRRLAVSRINATWNDDDYDRMELEAFVEKRS